MISTLRKQYETRLKKAELRIKSNEEEKHHLMEEKVALNAKCFKLEEEVRHHKVN